MLIVLLYFGTNDSLFFLSLNPSADLLGLLLSQYLQVQSCASFDGGDPWKKTRTSFLLAKLLLFCRIKLLVSSSHLQGDGVVHCNVLTRTKLTWLCSYEQTDDSDDSAERKKCAGKNSNDTSSNMSCFYLSQELFFSLFDFSCFFSNNPGKGHFSFGCIWKSKILSKRRNYPLFDLGTVGFSSLLRCTHAHPYHPTLLGFFFTNSVSEDGCHFLTFLPHAI